MKIRRSVLSFCAAAVVLIALLVLFGKRPSKRVSSSVAEKESVSEPATEQTETTLSQHESPLTSRTNTPKNEAVARANLPPSPTETKAERAREALVNPLGPRLNIQQINEEQSGQHA